MGRTVIKVESVSKKYRLGIKKKHAETLAGQVLNMIKSPWANLRRLRELNKFQIEDESIYWALKNVSFDVKEGEVLGIIGKNGAGKSTLLKILSRITEPTTGKIEIRGRVASLLEVGTGFHPELSGRENIYMNGTILGMTRREIDSKLDEIIDFSGVEKFIDTPVKFYSSGMKVRLGFSVAAHLDPEILIIDEVLAVGDYEFQKKCLGKMEDVSKNQGRTVLFVSHNMGAVSSLTTNGLLLKNGTISLYEKTSLVINKYLNERIENKVHNGRDLKVNLIEFFLLDNNIIVKNIAHDDDIFVSLRIYSNVKCINSIVSLTLFSEEGQKMATIHIKPFELKIGEISVDFNIEGNVIVPGEYYFNIHIHDFYTDYLVIERIFDFSIFDNGSPFVRWNGVDIGRYYLKFKNLEISYD